MVEDDPDNEAGAPSGSPEPSDVAPRVTHGHREWLVGEGESLSIGRQSTSDVVVGSAEPGPEDLGVSRRAATLSFAQGRIWVRNDSQSLPVFVRPAVGQLYVLERRGDMVSVAESRVEVALA